VHQVDEHTLCFNCAIANEFIDAIEKRSELKGDDAIDLATDLVDLAKCRALEYCRDGSGDARKAFFDDIG
jgi:hypothetical protein